jgi:hypothetical protein
MSDKEAVASELGGVGVSGSFASPDAYESVTEFLDAVHRASFEVWWTRDHRAGKDHDSAPVAIRRSQSMRRASPESARTRLRR